MSTPINLYVIIRGGLALDYSPEIQVFDLDVFESDTTDEHDLEYIRDSIWDRIPLLPTDYQKDFREECIEFVQNRISVLTTGHTDAEAYLNDEEPPA